MTSKGKRITNKFIVVRSVLTDDQASHPPLNHGLILGFSLILLTKDLLLNSRCHITAPIVPFIPCHIETFPPQSCTRSPVFLPVWLEPPATMHQLILDVAVHGIQGSRNFFLFGNFNCLQMSVNLWNQNCNKRAYIYFRQTYRQTDRHTVNEVLVTIQVPDNLLLSF